ncbi:transposase family protein [Streptomyces sp. NBC_00988]|uniref:transposase family protein n=1 Tax=Streptomyces sp. NBC_00988 TaxID=2903704 RepID=UPI00386452FE
MPAAPSSPIPAVLAKLGPLHQHDTGRLRVHLQRVPDPRSRRGQWYRLAGLLLICACAVVSGARTITQITEWGQRATTTVLEQLGIRRHLPGRRRAPSHATLTRLLAALDGDALDAAIGAYLAVHTDVGTTGFAPQPAIAVDGKALSGSAHRQHRHRPRHPPSQPCRPGRIRARTLGNRKFQPPCQRRGVRRGRLHRPHRQRTAGDGRSAEPGRRQTAAAGSGQHRQDHPSDPGRTEHAVWIWGITDSPLLPGT